MSVLHTSLSLWILVSATVACRTEQDPQSIAIEDEDTRAPYFVKKPHIDAVSGESVTVSFVTNENVDGAVVVTPPGILLTQAELWQHQDRRSFIGNPKFQTTVTVGDLAPGEVYVARIVMEDKRGNRNPEVVRLEFVTPTETDELSIRGLPSNAYEAVNWNFGFVTEPRDCPVRLKSGPNWLKLVSGNEVAGVPPFGTQSFAFTLEAESSICNGQRSFTVAVDGDPLAAKSWHLHNRGQASYAWYSGVPGFDVNGLETWAQGFTGRGIRVLVVDSGLLIHHPDLMSQVEEGSSINVMSGVAGCGNCDPRDPSPYMESGSLGDRGTAVAGVIAAQGWNGIGGRGIAPGARLIGYNLLADGFHRIAEDYLRMFQFDSDIIHLSPEPSSRFVEDQRPVDRVFGERLAAYSRSEGERRGGLLIKAAGDYGETGTSSQMDPYSTFAESLVVGSFNGLGRKSSGANYGSNIWVAGAGGERGLQSNPKKLPGRPFAMHFYPALVAPDLWSADLACQVGYAKGSRYYQETPAEFLDGYNLGASSGFNLNWHRDNPGCQHAASVSGTAAAAATVSGAIALLMEVNPQLSPRDLKDVLARSARIVDAQNTGRTTYVGGLPVPQVHPWKQNSAGFWFHNAFGFGAVDIDQALKLADPRFAAPLPPAQDSGWIRASLRARTIPANSVTGVDSPIFVDRGWQVETVQVKLNITHKHMSHIGVSLISPSGTQSILLHTQNENKFRDFDEMVLVSHAFYGEMAQGTWTLKVIDGKGGRTAGTLLDWSLRVHGHRRVAREGSIQSEAP